ncbi:hypothetical protein GS421_14175 [Rhodococcus hoagii]|nr:hypothetical protein [Prescottella equi]
MSAHAVTGAELDRVLGSILEAADGDFNTLLELDSRRRSSASGLAGVAGRIAREPRAVQAPRRGCA